MHRVESTATRNHDKFEGRVDKVLDDMESVRACAVCVENLQSPRTIQLPS